MIRTIYPIAAVVVAGGLIGGIVLLVEPIAAFPEPVAPVEPQPPANPESAEAGVKAITAEYQKAFNAGDAKAASMLWTPQGEYDGGDGEVFTGREAIEKSLVEYFKENAKATAEIRVESVKAISRGLATAEGVVRLTLPGAAESIESRYTALHTLEEGKWRAASVREWTPDPNAELAAQNLEWLVGDWSAKGDGGMEVKISYMWGAGREFLSGKYSVTKDGKEQSSGMQTFGRRPGDGLRSWMFDSSGTTSEGFWTRDGKQWMNESFGLLPDGTEVYGVNVLVPLGADAFTWQTIEREVNGEPVEPLPPIKVTRVKK